MPKKRRKLKRRIGLEQSLALKWGQLDGQLKHARGHHVYALRARKDRIGALISKLRKR